MRHKTHRSPFTLRIWAFDRRQGDDYTSAAYIARLAWHSPFVNSTGVIENIVMRISTTFTKLCPAEKANINTIQAPATDVDSQTVVVWSCLSNVQLEAWQGILSTKSKRVGSWTSDLTKTRLQIERPMCDASAGRRSRAVHQQSKE